MGATQFCRVCKKQVGLLAWGRHVAMHKKQFCRDTGKPVEEYREVDFEDVVKHYNPDRARPERNYFREVPKNTLEPFM